MNIKDILLPKWSHPSKIIPSNSFRGEESVVPIYEAVGRSLSMWELAESANIKLFQLLCETESFAACRAYGTLDSVYARHLALRYAAKEFFILRDEKDFSNLKKLINYYNETGKYRNQIAHGIAVQPHGYGYFLCPPSYSSRRRHQTPRPKEQWGLGADYFYRVKEIDHICLRFKQILNSTMSFVIYLNKKYSIIEESKLHP